MATRNTVFEAGSDAALNIQESLIIKEVERADGDTTVTLIIDVPMLANTKKPNKFYAYAQRLRDDGTNDENTGSLITVNSTSLPITVTGLTPERKYKISLKACIDTVCGNTVGVTQYQLSTSPLENTNLVATGLDPKKYTSGKSYLSISNSDAKAKKNIYQCYYRSFASIKSAEENSYVSEITSGALQNTIVGAGGNKYKIKNYKETHYIFGGSIFMDSNIEKPEQGASIGFFLDNNGTSGYFLTIETTSYSAARDKKTIRVVKVNGNTKTILKDSQVTIDNSYEGVYGGRTYNVAIRVKVLGKKTTISCNVNGFNITAVDTTEYKTSTVNGKTTGKVNSILPPTSRVGVVCVKGTAMFDYVYGSWVDKAKYEELKSNTNIYSGQFSDDILRIGYGDIIYNANNTVEEESAMKDQVEEFGTTVREIIKKTIKFDSRPSYPVTWSLGANDSVSILGSTRTNFGGEAYVLNNTSTTVPLSDGQFNQFYVIGNTLSDSGVLEYSTDELADYVTKEPVIFESQWLQNEESVKSLANWIKAEVVNKGKIVDVTVFGNPLIALGDIVTINYPYQGFNGTEKFIVTAISHTFSQGLETRVTCRLMSGTVASINPGEAPMTSSDPNVPVDLANATTTAQPGVGSELGKVFDSSLGLVTDVTSGITTSWTKGTGSDTTMLKIHVGGGKWTIIGPLSANNYAFDEYEPGLYLVEFIPTTGTTYGRGELKNIQVF